MSDLPNFTRSNTTAPSSRHIGMNEILNPVQGDSNSNNDNNHLPYSSPLQTSICHAISPLQSNLPVHSYDPTVSPQRQLPRSASTDTVSSLQKSELTRSHTESSIRQLSNFSLSITTPPPAKPVSLGVSPSSTGVVVQDRRTSARLSPPGSAYESAYVSQNDLRTRHPSPSRHGVPAASSPLQARQARQVTHLRAFKPRPPVLTASTNTSREQPSSPASDRPSNASPGTHQRVSSATGTGPPAPTPPPPTLIPYTIDWDSGSSKAAEKRRKSSFASKKFRQRKKARQWEQAQMARQQGMENRWLKEERDCYRAESDFYRNERDFLRSWVESLGVRVPERPPSPRWPQFEAELGRRRMDVDAALATTSSPSLSPTATTTTTTTGGGGGEIGLDSDEEKGAPALAIGPSSSATSRPRIGSLPARLGYSAYPAPSDHLMAPPPPPPPPPLAPAPGTIQMETAGAFDGSETEPALHSLVQLPSLKISRFQRPGTPKAQH